MKKSTMNAINAISSNAEMNEVIDLIKLKQKQLRDIIAWEARGTLTVGQKVKINGAKHGVQFGIIERIKQKKAIVIIDGRKWDCPLTIIQAA